MCTLSRAMNWPSCWPSLLSGLAETWWNSSTAISRSSNASTPNLSTAKRKVAWVQTSTLSSLSRNAPTDIDLAAVVRARRVAEVPFRLDRPVRPEAELAQRLVIEARADRLLRHDDDRLLEP